MKFISRLLFQPDAWYQIVGELMPLTADDQMIVQRSGVDAARGTGADPTPPSTTSVRWAPHLLEARLTRNVADLDLDLLEQLLPRWRDHNAVVQSP